MKTTLFLVFFLAFNYCLNAQFVQWRGPNRDGQFTETELLKSWPENGPEQILEVENIGKGWSSPIPLEGVIYTTGMIDTLDYLTAINAADGSIKYQVSYGRSWNQSYPDTRSTPTIEDDRIYVQSGTGRLACIDRETGKENWAIEVDKQFEGEYHVWGNSETPLIVDNKVICSPGGQNTSIVAFDKLTGETIWKSESSGGPRGYSSATLFELNDNRYILALTASHVMALHPESGEIAWSYQYFDSGKWRYQPNGLIWTNTPLVKGNEIFLSMGYNYPAVMLQIDPSGTSVSEKFTDNTLDNHHGGLILYDGFIYGTNWVSNSQGKWVCMNWDTGEIKYETEWESKGSLVMAEDLLYGYNERGTVGLIKPSPDGFEVISEFKITKGAGPHWAHPFIANGNLYIRHGDVLMVYNIKAN